MFLVVYTKLFDVMEYYYSGICDFTDVDDVNDFAEFGHENFLKLSTHNNFIYEAKPTGHVYLQAKIVYSIKLTTKLKQRHIYNYYISVKNVIKWFNFSIRAAPTKGY